MKLSLEVFVLVSTLKRESNSFIALLYNTKFYVEVQIFTAVDKAVVFPPEPWWEKIEFQIASNCRELTVPLHYLSYLA